MAYDKTTFLSGLAMGLCGKGDPTFEGSGKMLYNGVGLPDINSVWTDKVKRPYAYLIDVPTESRFYLWLSEVRFGIRENLITGSLLLYASETGSRLRYECHYKETEFYSSKWSFVDEFNDVGSMGDITARVPIWSNVDILNMGGSVYLAASEPIPVEDAFTKGYHVGAALRRKRRLPVAYLYNGVRLPNINSVYTPKLQKDYPFAFVKIPSNGRIQLCLFGAEAHYFEYTRPSSEVRLLFGSPPSWDDGLVDDGIKVPMQHYECAEYSNYQWTLAYETSDGYVDITPPTNTPHWSNFDIGYNGSVYLEASDPIPVYE